MAKAHEGACKAGDKGCDCPNYNHPVCGQDFITYNNPCSLDCQSVVCFNNNNNNNNNDNDNIIIIIIIMIIL